MQRGASQATPKRRQDTPSEGAPAQFDLDEVAKKVADFAANMDGDKMSVAARMIEEIEILDRVIKAARSEIVALNPSEVRERQFATATDELDAVVGATEDATNTIMEAAERIEVVAEKVDEGPARQLTDAVTNIYEACGFQDITGQRIGKVVGALRQIELKVEALLAAFGDKDARARRDRLKSELDRREGRDGGLLSGPQGQVEAQNQDDIDALFDD